MATVTINGTSSDWTAQLKNATLKAAMDAIVAAGEMTHDNLVTLVQDVINDTAAAGLSADNLADLQLILANMNNGFGASSDLVAALRVMVNGSPANQYYYGGSADWTELKDLDQTTYGLKAGVSAATMTDLVKEWLKGADMPDPTTNDGHASAYANYSAQTLYGAEVTPQVKDIMQGDLGDCVICSTMIDMALNHNQTLQSNIVSYGNGVYSVRFYINGQELWETVNSSLPTDTDKALVYNNAYSAANSAGANGLWADLIEKAYAQLGATGQVGHTGGINSYSNVSGNDAMIVMSAFTGTQTNDYNSVDANNAATANWDYDKQVIIDALKSGEDVEVGTSDAKSGNAYVTVDGVKVQTFVNKHELAIIGYDAATDKFIIRNPWGTNNADPTAPSGEGGQVAGQGGGTPYLAQFEASMAEIQAVGGSITIDTSVKSQVDIAFANNTPYLSSAGTQDIAANSSVKVSSLFSVVDTAGLSIKTYDLQVVGAGSLNLHGVQPVSQTAAGDYVVNASDLAKVTYDAGDTTGGAVLLVSATDSAGVTAPTADIALTVSNIVASAAPIFNQVVAANSAITLDKLMSLYGDLSSDSGQVQVEIKSGGGALAVSANGNSYMSGAKAEVSFNELGSVTYTADATSGQVVLDIVTTTDGANWGDYQYFALYVGANTATALQNYDNGLQVYGQAIYDTEANVLNDLDGVQTAVTADNILAIQLSDNGGIGEVSGAQLLADFGALSMISGVYTVDVSQLASASLASNIDKVATYAHLGTVTLTDGGVLMSLTNAQVAADAALLSKITNDVWGYSTSTVTAYTFNSASASATVAAGSTLPITVKGFVAGDRLNLAALGANDAIVTNGATVTLSGNGQSETFTFDSAATASQVSLSVSGGVDTLTICFMAGTMIATPDGERAIETLSRGDLVLTAEGEVKPVRWIGRQTISTRFADPLRNLPIRVKARALGDNCPSRDLLVSPDHALLVEDMLVHAGALVNGTTICRETAVPEIFVYYHVELDDHSLILAENVPAESFIDNADRRNFDNWAEHEALYPQGRAMTELAAPRIKAQRQLPRLIRAAVAARAALLRAHDGAQAPEGDDLRRTLRRA